MTEIRIVRDEAGRIISASNLPDAPGEPLPPPEPIKGHYARCPYCSTPHEIKMSGGYEITCRDHTWVIYVGDPGRPQGIMLT